MSRHTLLVRANLKCVRVLMSSFLRALLSSRFRDGKSRHALMEGLGAWKTTMMSTTATTTDDGDDDDDDDGAQLHFFLAEARVNPNGRVGSGRADPNGRVGSGGRDIKVWCEYT